MMFRKLTALFLAAVLLFTIAACDKKEKEPQEPSSSEPVEEIDPNWPVEVGDIRIEEKPARIVSLSPALTEVVYELGGGDRLLGVSDFCDYPQEAAEKEKCGSAQLPDFELIKEIKPDLVLVSAPLTQDATVKLQQQNAEVVVLPHASSLDEMEATYTAIALMLDGAVDGQENGIAVFSALRSQYDALRDRADSIGDRLSGVYLREPPLTMATGDTFEGTLLEIIGVKNDAGEYTNWTYPADQAVNLYPDILFYADTIDPEYFKGTQVYNTTDAYKNDRMYAVNPLAFERQSARMFDELEKMFAYAYPDAGGAALPEDEADGLDSSDGSEASLSGIVEEPKDE